MADSKPIVAYWGIRGLGQPIRFLIAYLDIDVKEKRYTIGEEEWASDKLSLGLDFPNLPYLIDGSMKLTESRAILRHLARENGEALFPSTSEANRTVDMLENVIFDVWFALIRYCNYKVESMKVYLDDEIPKKFNYLNKFLENKKYILGIQLSYVDFFLYEMLFHFCTYEATYLEKYPNLAAFKTAFEQIPAIARYITSSDYIKGPCINPFAAIPI